MYRYQRLVNLRELINEIYNSLIITCSALYNIDERMTINNIKIYLDVLLNKLNLINQRIENIELDMIINDNFNRLKIKLSELESLTQLLYNDLINRTENEEYCLEDIFNILIVIANDCKNFAENSRCKIFPNEDTV